jgi:hypothetical protein
MENQADVLNFKFLELYHPTEHTLIAVDEIIVKFKQEKKMSGIKFPEAYTHDGGCTWENREI